MKKAIITFLFIIAVSFVQAGYIDTDGYYVMSDSELLEFDGVADSDSSAVMQVSADGSFTVSDMASQNWAQFSVSTSGTSLPSNISGAIGWKLILEDTTATLGSSNLFIAVWNPAGGWQQSIGTGIISGRFGTAYLDITGTDNIGSFNIIFQSSSGVDVRSYLQLQQRPVIPDSTDEALSASYLLGRGINLGNTLEADYEGWWDDPAEEFMFEDYAAAGFKHVRIPVRWDNHMGTADPYTINPTFMARVEQVVDWGLNHGLAVILNSHHDNWIKQSPDATDHARFDALWQQVSWHFRNKSEKLVFEIFNEPDYNSTLSVDDINTIQHRVLDIIRVNDPTRYVMLSNHYSVYAIDMPDDPYIIANFHYYTPWGFCGEGTGTWGSADDIQQVIDIFDNIQLWAVENNAPVYMGEFGVITDADRTSRLAWYDNVVAEAVNRGFSFACWEHQGAFEIYDYEGGVYTRTWDTEVLDRLINSGTWPTFCTADWDLANNDCLVNNEDFSVFSGDWLPSGSGYDLTDLQQLVTEWLECLQMPACDAN
ncbi:MAG: glycoside hydrolase family 5 protein [Sedimentisphaerales bacterium]|nr:glycoside hydrolase family 5 protein [Sedimentisphaerales bacterium]